ncbi:MAG: dodecin family protein [Gemmatimonadales bacterium]
MSIAKVIEISAESNKSLDDCLMQGIQEASKTVKNITSAWVKNHEVLVEDGKIRKHRVHLDVTFVVDGRS